MGFIPPRTNFNINIGSKVEDVKTEDLANTKHRIGAELQAAQEELARLKKGLNIMTAWAYEPAIAKLEKIIAAGKVRLKAVLKEEVDRPAREAAQKAAQEEADRIADEEAARLAAEEVKAKATPTQFESSVPKDALPGLGLDTNFTSDQYKVDPALRGPSAQATTKADQDAIDAQKRAMGELFGLYEKGGATALERARMAKTRADQDQYLRSQREAHQQDLTERGMMGSGAEIAMLLGDRQAAGQRMSQADLETEAMLEKRALDALLAGSDLAGSVRKSSFEEEGYRNEGKDDVEIYNKDVENKARFEYVDFLRDQKDKKTREEVDAWALRLKLGAEGAGTMLDFDQAENVKAYEAPKDIVVGDVEKATEAEYKGNNVVLGQHGDPATNFGVAGQTAGGISGTNTKDVAGVQGIAGGAGQAGGGVAGIVTEVGAAGAGGGVPYPELPRK